MTASHGQQDSQTGHDLSAPTTPRDEGSVLDDSQGQANQTLGERARAPRTHARTHACTHARTHARTHACTHALMFTRPCMRIKTHACTRLDIWQSTHTCMRPSACIKVLCMHAATHSCAQLCATHTAKHAFAYLRTHTLTRAPRRSIHNTNCEAIKYRT